MWINTGKNGLVNMDKFAQITIEATQWDTYWLITSNDDIEEEVRVLGEYETKAKAERVLSAIAVELGKQHCILSLYDNWLPDDQGILGMDCMSR